MASSINRVMLTGRLTRDAELRQTQGGTGILRFGIAVNDRRRNQQTGEWEDYANFVDLVVFGQRATALAQYLAKGTQVAVEGKLRWSQGERDGAKHSKIEVVVDELVLCGSRQQPSQPQQQAPNYSRPPQMPATAPQMPQNAPQMPQGYANPPQQQMAPQMPSQPPAQQYQQAELYDDDIPFMGPYTL